MRTAGIGMSAGILMVLAACAAEGPNRSEKQVYRDNEIQATVFFALQKEPELSDIRVRSFKGEVTLSGTVAAEEHRRKAELLVRDIRGVQSVRNEVVVNGSPSPK